MEVLLENVVIYGFVGVLFIFIFYIYIHKQKKESKIVEEKIKKAKKMGTYEPVSLHPVVDINSCIGSGACIAACPEKDVLGIRNGKATTINASRCIGHSACFIACPVGAISLHIGTEQRGVQIPHVNPNFETTIPGIFIAGEIGGMGLIKNAVEQGKQAVENLTKTLDRKETAEYDLIIVGSGPAGISASLQAKKNGLKFLTLEQDSLGGTVFTYPRSKIVMTSPMDLPLYGRLKLVETTKSELLDVWVNVLKSNEITIRENEKVNEIQKFYNTFKVISSKNKYTTKKVLLAIGRRGTPRKLGVPGEGKEKVAYRLLEPELIHNKNILVVGGGDSAVEAAMILSDENNNVTLSYRKGDFTRIKPKNMERINEKIESNLINMLFNSTVTRILDDSVELKINNEETINIDNELVYIFIGGELPTKFLEHVGIKISMKHGEAMLKN
ncbi:Thioredoxin reductase [hydrothermal vent metagenome]|uniref:Thioredoxin reductase n=1 Tax=hydrothermal vent metagenome TaxID=652676 RepID=A0A3B1D3C4_9ZZZZ